MKRNTLVILSSVTLLLLAYGWWTTVQMLQLQARLARLEASQNALGRYTYDFAAALTHLNDLPGVPGPELAKSVLQQMQQDDLLRPAIESPRARAIIPTSHLRNRPHNIVETLQ